MTKNCPQTAKASFDKSRFSGDDDTIEKYRNEVAVEQNFHVAFRTFGNGAQCVGHGHLQIGVGGIVGLGQQIDEPRYHSGLDDSIFCSIAANQRAFQLAIKKIETLDILAI